MSFFGYLERVDDSVIVETPDGLRGERCLLVDEFVERGDIPITLQSRLERGRYPGVFYDPNGFPSLDVLFIEWRWLRPGKDTVDWDRQCELLDHYSRVGTPIVVQDTDLKITEDDERRWPSMVICDPCLKPRKLTRPRMFMPFCSTFKRAFAASTGALNYRYVGNDYERREQFKTYYAEPAERLRASGVQTIAHGNWLRRSVERPDPGRLIKDHPHVAFAPRCSHRDVRALLNDSVAVCHITKPEYALHGNVSMRYFEAIEAGVPALVPKESIHMRDVGDAAGLMVGSSADVVRKVKNLLEMSAKDRAILVDSQERALRSLADFSPRAKAATIVAVACKEIKP
jgi:hypothetical protein